MALVLPSHSLLDLENETISISVYTLFQIHRMYLLIFNYLFSHVIIIMKIDSRPRTSVDISIEVTRSSQYRIRLIAKQFVNCLNINVQLHKTMYISLKN